MEALDVVGCYNELRRCQGPLLMEYAVKDTKALTSTVTSELSNYSKIYFQPCLPLLDTLLKAIMMPPKKQAEMIARLVANQSLILLR